MTSSRSGAPAVALVDWGTSSLRVWLLDRDANILGERRSHEGMQHARTVGFSDILERMLGELGAPADTPAIVCGMAGARQGWVEAPYAFVPCTLDDIFSSAIKVNDAKRLVRIVPGLAQRDTGHPDVMRGEETQLAGALDSLGDGEHVLCLPGTHSKWVAVSGKQITGFSSWMTGELFNVFATKTILMHSIGEESGAASFENPQFDVGLRLGLEDGGALTSLLFNIRASTLLKDMKPVDAASRLSGLVIGAELAAAKGRYLTAGRKLVLVASGVLQRTYAAALDRAGLIYETVDADAAVRKGLISAARVNGMLAEQT